MPVFHVQLELICLYIFRYYANHTEYKFKAKILEVFPNVSKNMAPNIIVLDQSHFYPTSGGQENDTGALVIKGINYKVVDVTKVKPLLKHVDFRF